MCTSDDGVNWSLQNGLYLSRSKVKYFKHNDMKDLKARLEEVRKEDKRKKPLNRRFIIVEAIYQVCWTILPPKICLCTYFAEILSWILHFFTTVLTYRA